jgi:phospholipid N-methyltransferase
MPRALSPSGSAVVIQYSPLIEPELRRRFGSVRRRISPRNVPPAFLFACTSPLTAPGSTPGAAPPG